MFRLRYGSPITQKVGIYIVDDSDKTKTLKVINFEWTWFNAPKRPTHSTGLNEEG